MAGGAASSGWSAAVAARAHEAWHTAIRRAARLPEPATRPLGAASSGTSPRAMLRSWQTWHAPCVKVANLWWMPRMHAPDLAVIEAIEVSIASGGGRVPVAAFESSPPRRPPWAGWRPVRPAGLSRRRGSRHTLDRSGPPRPSFAVVEQRLAAAGVSLIQRATTRSLSHWSGRDLAGRSQRGHRPYPPRG